MKFKPLAYRRAAQNIETFPESIEKVNQRGGLREIIGVGESISSKIKEIIETGRLKYLEELRSEFPKGIEEFTKIEGIGLKTALNIIKEVEINTIDQLETAIKEKKLRDIRGFGVKKEEAILRGIELYKASRGRFLLGEILPIAKSVEDELRKLDVVQKINIAGSMRRRAETIGDVDVLIVSKEPAKVMKFFTQMKSVKKIVSEGETKGTVILTNNLQVDLRVVDDSSYGSALLYFTGSKEHNVKLRELCKKKNWKLNEYGLFDNASNKIIAGQSEVELYKVLGLDYIEPELRESRGEIEAAKKGTLPKLIEHDDIKGDLHMHTSWSDGAHSIEEMATTAKKYGYEYIAICDHSQGLKIVRNLGEEEIRKQMKEIERINRKMDGFTVLSGIELNISSDGHLDIRNAVLKDLDIVIASVHSGLKKDEKTTTERVLKAIHNDHVNILGHPTGRIINKRSPLQIDLLKIFEAAGQLGIVMEINAFPDRLDLSDLNCFKARNYNMNFSIGTDAHNKEELKFMEFGVSTARRGWLEKRQILNALSLKHLRELL